MSFPLLLDTHILCPLGPTVYFAHSILMQIQIPLEPLFPLQFGGFLLWYRSLRGHLLCEKSMKTKIGRSNLPRFIIPAAKVLRLMGGIDPQDRFSLNTKLKEFYFLRVPNWSHWLRISILGYFGALFNHGLVNWEKTWLFSKHAQMAGCDPSKWSSRGRAKILQM